MDPTSALSLRAPEPRDVNLIYIWENSSDEAHTTLRTGPVSRFQIEEFVRNYDSEIYTAGSLRFMIDVVTDNSAETVGTIDVFDYDHRNRHAFVGIYITPKQRRRGLAAQALETVCGMMKAKVGMHSLAALVAENNAASRALFEAAGFKPSGRLQSWFDTGEGRLNALVYQRML